MRSFKKYYNIYLHFSKLPFTTAVVCSVKLFSTSWKQRKVQVLVMLFQLEMHAKFPLCAATFLTCSNFWFLHQMNAAPPHEIFLLQWRGFLLPVFKHELRSLRFGAVCRERWHSKLVIAALWGFFLHRHQIRELNCRINIMDRSPMTFWRGG